MRRKNPNLLSSFFKRSFEMLANTNRNMESPETGWLIQVKASHFGTKENPVGHLIPLQKNGCLICWPLLSFLMKDVFSTASNNSSQTQPRRRLAAGGSGGLLQPMTSSHGSSPLSLASCLINCRYEVLEKR